MKRVLILVNHEVVIYNFRLEIVERLIEEGHEVYISSPAGEKIEELVSLGCKHVDLSINRHGTNVVEELKLLSYYKKILKQIKPDVVLSFTIKPNIYGGIACRFLNIPFIANITGLGTAVEKKSIMQNISIGLYKIAFKKVKRVFFQNRENMQFFINHNIAVGKHQLIPGSGVNLERFPIQSYPNDNITEFVFISRIMKEKGIDQYLEAAQFIKNKNPNTVFHVCGFCEEAYEEKLKVLHNRGIIHYHGMVRNIKDVLKRSHCTVHPTYYPEGLSNVLLESAASGRPIITTDRSGCREVVDNGINGYMLKQKDSENLIKTIEKFIKLEYKLKEQMGLKGRVKVEKEFDRQIVVDAYLKEIDKV